MVEFWEVHLQINCAEEAMKASVYNTKDGIRTMLGSLEDFWKVIEARRSYNVQELNEFYVLGRFVLDQGGGVFRLDPKLELAAGMDLVMTGEEFLEYLQNNRPGIRTSDCKMDQDELEMVVPAPHMVDPISGKGWNIGNCYEVVVLREQGVPLSDVKNQSSYRGKTVRAVLRDLNKRRDGWYVRASDGRMRYAYSRKQLVDEDLIVSADTNCYFVDVNRFCYPENHDQMVEMIGNRQFDLWMKEVAVWLKDRGFTTIVIERAELPSQFKHRTSILDKSYPSAYSEIPFWAEENPYVRVSTDQGSFGMMIGTLENSSNLWCEFANYQCLGTFWDPRLKIFVCVNDDDLEECVSLMAVQEIKRLRARISELEAALSAKEQ